MKLAISFKNLFYNYKKQAKASFYAHDPEQRSIGNPAAD